MNTTNETTYGVYIHIPFCRKKCGYCDFPSVAGREADMEAYTDALCKEIASQRDELSARGKAATVYIGGGTPTALPVPLLARVIQAAESFLPLAEDCEFTVEANPGTVTLETMTMLSTLGVNRVSIGAQSFDDATLKRIGRIHTAQDIRDAVRWARAALIVNVSVDLMYGLPGQTMDDLKWSVGSSMDLAVNHISVYGLTVEDGTPFAREKENGTLHLPSEDAEEEMYDYLAETLPKFGFRRYEISNYARHDFICRHNLAYWQDRPYFGFGAAAHSYHDGRRTANTKDLGAYIKAVKNGESPAHTEETVTQEKHIEEFCFLALRTAEGIDRKKFAETFGCETESLYEKSINELKTKKFLEETPTHFRLTPLGMKFGNQSFEAFLL
ncbi:MAG: radical SAM family heme chaperone HemW [Schwartzia sp.]|nr:radical SAM family heme chaperone HemW [Schwartzia sp. (in: firmicutes)]